MVDRRRLWLLLPAQLRRLPADLVAMLAVAVLVNIAVFAPIIRETPLRIPLGLVFVLFVPGYVFIAALFPEAGESPVASEDGEQNADGDEETGWAEDTGWADKRDEHATDETDDTDASTWIGNERSGIDGIERVALAFGLSIAIVPLIGLILNFTPWGIRLGPIMVATTGFTVLMTGIAAVRRWELPEDERFAVPYRGWYRTGRTELLEPETQLDGILNVILVFSILLAVGSVTFAIVVPPQGEQFSAVYILTEDDEGDLVAANYPSQFERGVGQELVVGVDNHEHRTVDYTVVVAEQTVDRQGNETVVTDQQELDRFETQLEHNGTWHHPHEVAPTMVGEDIRIVWLLYPDEVPEEPSIDNTEYHVHLWVDVSE